MRLASGLLSCLCMKAKTITIEHPVAHITIISRRSMPRSVCQRTIRSIEGVLNAAQILAEESKDSDCVVTEVKKDED